MKIVVKPRNTDCVFVFATSTETRPRLQARALMEQAAADGDIPVVLKWALNEGSVRGNCLFVAVGDARVPFYLEAIEGDCRYDILVEVSNGQVGVDYDMRYKAPEMPPKRPYKHRSKESCKDAD